MCSHVELILHSFSSCPPNPHINTHFSMFAVNVKHVSRTSVFVKTLFFFKRRLQTEKRMQQKPRYYIFDNVPLS